MNESNLSALMFSYLGIELILALIIILANLTEQSRVCRTLSGNIVQVGDIFGLIYTYNSFYTINHSLLYSIQLCSTPLKTSSCLSEGQKISQCIFSYRNDSVFRQDIDKSLKGKVLFWRNKYFT